MVMHTTFRNGAVLAGLGVLVAIVSVRCANVDRGLGQACIRNSDCLSGICAGQECVASPTLFDASTAFDAGVDSGASDSAKESSSGSDTGTPMKDAGHPQPDARAEAGDAAVDAVMDGNHDANMVDASTPDGALSDAGADVHHVDAVADGSLKDSTSE